MSQPTRLFDCLDLHLKDAPSRTMIAGKENGSWREFPTSEVSALVNKLSAGLVSMGYGNEEKSPEGKDKIAVIAKNRPEWIMLDLAVQKIGAVLTPIYPTVSDIDLEFILRDCRAKVIFTNDQALTEKVHRIKGNLPDLQEVFSFDRVEGTRYWEDILALGEEADLKKVEDLSARIAYEDLATIIYTSGTTGKPKGVMLSHRNILSNVVDCLPCFPPGDNLKALSFLPLNHIFERMVTYLYLFRGTSIFYAESLETIGDNLKEVRPHLFTTVPRLLEKVYEKIMLKGEELTGIKRKLFFWAHGLANKYEINKNQGFIYNFQLSLANKIIFSKWREALGNNIVCVISGGAACQVRLIRIFTAANVPVMEGYGLTETSPVISVNRYEVKDRMFGTVGPLIDNVEVKIAEDGEILCKGPNVMMGYFKNTEATAEAFTPDGWFKTGDIGIMVEDRFLKITDRKKEMFKTSGGKYVAPVAIENKLKESPLIENVMVIGDGRKFVSALVVPSFEYLRAWCRDNKMDYTDNAGVIADPRVKAMYRAEIDRFNELFNHVEQVKKFELLPREWGIDSGELTPKMSMKRKVVLEKYKKIINSIYE